MAVTTRRIAARPEDVFAVLADGWLYPVWVVGASRARAVTERFPREGGEIQHSFGVWPVLLNDKTVVLEWDPPRRVRLRARGWPIGEAEVLLEARAAGTGCVVRIVEDAVKGPGRLVPAPIRRIGLFLRNRETLRRLAYLAEGHARS
ncbi:MAG: hypothetical protein JWP66_801 [Naasia sp.]|nr:hypothetical protein [Naasia sp.]